MRGRAWRRYAQERIVLKRLSRHQRPSYWRFIDANGVLRRHCLIIAYMISTELEHRAKTHTTTRWDTRHKTKYSPNKCQSRWRDKGKGETREEAKLYLMKILREHGLK